MQHGFQQYISQYNKANNKQGQSAMAALIY